MLTNLEKYKVLRGIVSPRPWPIIEVKGDFMLNCGPSKIFCHDRATLEFIQACIEIAEATVPSPNKDAHP